MATLENISVDLTPDLAASIREAVDGGDYTSAGDVVRDALLEWRLRRTTPLLGFEDLRKLIREGIESGPGLEADEVFADLERRFGKPAAL
jgi:antitoxin ParD1/3/4